MVKRKGIHDEHDADTEADTGGFEIAPGYEPGLTEATDMVEMPDFNSFTLMELKALQEYAKDLDLTRACAAAGYKAPSQQAYRLKQKPAIWAEMAEIHRVWRTNMLEMTAEHASAKHINLMKKFEKDYDSLPGLTEKGETSVKGQLAGTLGKMSSDYLRSCGHFDKDSGGQEAQMVINIDLGDGGNGSVEVDKGGKRAKVSKRRKDEADEDAYADDEGE